MVLKKLKHKLKDPSVQMQIAFSLTLIFLWVALTRPWEGLEWGF